MQCKFNREKALHTVDLMLFRRSEIKRALAEKRMRMRKSYDDCEGHAHVKDGTAVNAMNDMKPIQSVMLESGAVVRNPEQWLQAIYLLEQVLGEFETTIFRKFYIQRYKASEIENQRTCSRNTAYFAVNEIRNTFLGIAIQMGLVTTYREIA